MNPIPYQPAAPPPPWPPMVPPNPPMTSTFWETSNVRERLKNLQDTLRLAKAMQKELEMVMLIKDGKRAEDDDGASVSEFSEFLKERRINLESQVSLSVEAANALMAKLRVELAPFRAITHEMCPWEEKSAALRLSNKIRKCKRNKRWRKAKRKCIAEMIAKVDWFVPYPSSFPIGMQKVLNWFNLLTFFIALVMHIFYCFGDAQEW